MKAHSRTIVVIPALLCALLANSAQGQPTPQPTTPDMTVVTGVIKEVNPLRKTITYLRMAEGSYGKQQVTDLMFLHPNVTISLNGMKTPLKDLRPGDSIVFECLPKPERAIRVAALSPEQLEKLQKEKERIKEFERKVEADHLRLIKELARKEFAKDLERAREKAKADAEKAKAGADKKDDDPMPKDAAKKEKKEPPKKDPPLN